MESKLRQDGHIGVVKSVSGGFASVEFVRSSACAHCGACLTLDSGKMETKVKNLLNAKVGDCVSVEIRPQKIVSATLLAYGVPLAMLLLGLGLGSLISEIVSMAAGLLLCVASYFILRVLEPRFARNESYQPHMTAIVNQELEETKHE